MTRRLLGPVGGPIIYFLVAGLVFAGLGWVTVAALRVEEAQRQSAARADLEKDVQGALWRLDGRVLPALGVEDSRPFYHYTNYTPEDPTTAYGPPCAPLLAAELPTWMRLHFQIDPDTGWQSPQILTAEAADRLRRDWPGLDPRNATPERAKLVAALRTKYQTRAVIDVFAARERAVPSGAGALPAWLFAEGAAAVPGEEVATPPAPTPAPAGSDPKPTPPAEPPTGLPPVTLPPGADPATEAVRTQQRERQTVQENLDAVKDRTPAEKKETKLKETGPPPPAPAAPDPRPAQTLPEQSFARSQARSLGAVGEMTRGGFNDRYESSKRALDEARRMAPPYIPLSQNSVQGLAFGTPALGTAPANNDLALRNSAGYGPPPPPGKPDDKSGPAFASLAKGASSPGGTIGPKTGLSGDVARPPAARAYSYSAPTPPAEPGGTAVEAEKAAKDAMAAAKKTAAELAMSGGNALPKPGGAPAKQNPTAAGKPEAGRPVAGEKSLRPPEFDEKAGMSRSDKTLEDAKGLGFFKQIEEYRAKATEQRGLGDDRNGMSAADGRKNKMGATGPGPAPDRLASKMPTTPGLAGPARSGGVGGGVFPTPAAPAVPFAMPPGGPKTPPVPGPIPPTPNPGPPVALVPAEPPALPPPARDSAAGGRAEMVGPPEPTKREDPPHAPAAEPPPAVTVHLGSMRPQWVTAADGTEILVLVRAARLESKTVFQGVVLDWPKLQEILKDEIKDQFPDAKLVPVKGPAGVSRERVMTALPVQLDPGPTPEPPPPGWTPLRLGLALAWTAAVIAFAAVGLCGWSLIDLAERRIRFVSAVTHELRTPLTSLRLYLDLLLSGMVQDEEKRKEYLSTLNAESDRLHRLIDNVLDFARLERRRKGGDVQPVKVADLLEHVRRTWTDRCATDGKELVVISTLPPEQEVCTDAELVQQVVGNLIDNARKYTRDASDTRIWLWAKRDGPTRVVLEVEDRGAGVPPREQKLIFRPFRRGAAADTKAGGAGLGLALSRQWAEVLGGKLTYHSADGGVGACFRLELAVK